MIIILWFMIQMCVMEVNEKGKNGEEYLKNNGNGRGRVLFFFTKI